jgi:hypothetical protein
MIEKGMNATEGEDSRESFVNKMNKKAHYLKA